MEQKNIEQKYHCGDFKELVCFSQGLRKLGGAICGPYFNEILEQCKALGSLENASSHFSDMASIDIMIIIGGDPKKTDPEGRFSPGLHKFSIGKNPKRYIADLYVPIGLWFGKPHDDPEIRIYLADGFRKVFDTVLHKAAKVNGRLLNRNITEISLSSFITEFSKMETELPLYLHSP